jgi:hypothetical protein
MDATALVPLAPAGSVVAPMILQFFVLAALWFTLYGPGGALPGGPASTRLPLPLLMLGAGALFFSSPLAPLWRPLVGGEGGGVPALPVPVALGCVALLNLGVLAAVVNETGGMRGSPVLPLLLALLPAGWLVIQESSGVGVAMAGAALVLVAGAVARDAPSRIVLARGLAGALVVLAVALALGRAAAALPAALPPAS